MMECPQIKAGMEYTEDDWNRLELIAQELSGCDFRTYLNKMATRMAGHLQHLEMEEGKKGIKKQKIFTIKADFSCLIQMAAIERGTNPGRLLSRLIAHPMLKQYHDKYGF